MKEMTLQEVQALSLDIMKHLHAFCVEHNIKYSLGYGSLIGAIRHRGFIPWDDDMDVVMMREDFDRFCDIYENTAEYKLFSLSRGNMFAPLARLCDMKRTSTTTVSPLFSERTGIWIDIFPLDSVDDDKNAFERKVAPIVDYYLYGPLCRWNTNSIKEKLKHPRTSWNGIKAWFRHRYGIKELMKRHNNAITTFVNRNSNMMSNLAFPAYIKRDWCPKDVFNETIDVPFEDTFFKAMKGYDQWLRIIYGDYMQLPPEEKRVAGHDMHKYFWK